MAAAIIHFEIQASDVERAIAFYTQIFGWKIERYGDMEYWGIRTGRGEGGNGEKVGINGGLLRRKGGQPADGAPVNAFVCSIDVEDIDKMTEDIKKAGGGVVVEKTAVEGMLWQCYCKDTEGNTFGLVQIDSNAGK